MSLTFFGLSGALGEEQLVLLVGEGFWKDSGHQRTERNRNISVTSLVFRFSSDSSHLTRGLNLPHRVRQRQDAQAEEVDGQQQVDVLLRKHLRQNRHTRLDDEQLCRRTRSPWRRAEETLSYLEEEVETKQSAAGDDGKPGRISTGDGLWHVGSILGGEMKQNDSRASDMMQRKQQ